MDKSRNVNVRLTQDLLDQLQQDSYDSERTVAQTVRLAVKQYLAREMAPA